MKCIICNNENKIEEGKNVCNICRDAKYIIFSETNFEGKTYHVTQIEKETQKSLILRNYISLFYSYGNIISKKKDEYKIVDLKTALKFKQEYDKIYKNYEKDKNILKEKYINNVNSLFKTREIK